MICERAIPHKFHMFFYIRAIAHHGTVCTSHWVTNTEIPQLSSEPIKTYSGANLLSPLCMLFHHATVRRPLFTYKTDTDSLFIKRQFVRIKISTQSYAVHRSSKENRTHRNDTQLKYYYIMPVKSSAHSQERTYLRYF